MSAPILDQTDREIIILLEQEPTLNSKEIATKLRRRPSTMLNRYNRLISLGYIKESIPTGEMEKFDGMMVVIINVQLNDHFAEALNNFQEEISAFKQVMECYQTTGQVDFVLKVVVKDMSDYQVFLVQTLSKMPIVKSYTSHFVINEKRKASGRLEPMV
ncbi:MAG: Lrp/AsnC family transcriptional regulator [Bacteroidota bacterium]